MTKKRKRWEKPWGFAALDLDERRRIASMGGKAAHAGGNASKFTSATASAAAKSGHEKGTVYRFSSEKAREAGRKGGLQRGRNLARRAKGAKSD